MLEERRLEEDQVRLPPLARQRVETASAYLDDKALEELRRAGQQLRSDPTEAALALGIAQDWIYRALKLMAKACNGRAGVEEKRTLGVTSTKRSLGTE